MSFPTFRAAVAVTHSWVGSSFTREDTRGVLGAKVPREKALDFSVQLPPGKSAWLLASRRERWHISSESEARLRFHLGSKPRTAAVGSSVVGG
jgi:hypothetical protein